MRKLELYWAENGWLIKSVEDGEPDRYTVFSHRDSDDGKEEAEAFSSLLWEIKSLMGPSESRYSKYRVMVNLEEGDKYEPQE